MKKRYDVSELRFHLDDLSGEATRSLIARHLAGMHANSQRRACTPSTSTSCGTPT